MTNELELIKLIILLHNHSRYYILELFGFTKYEEGTFHSG